VIQPPDDPEFGAVLLIVAVPAVMFGLALLAIACWAIIFLTNLGECLLRRLGCWN